MIGYLRLKVEQVQQHVRTNVDLHTSLYGFHTVHSKINKSRKKNQHIDFRFLLLSELVNFYLKKPIKIDHNRKIEWAYFIFVKCRSRSF